jgi:hypothetical protein
MEYYLVRVFIVDEEEVHTVQGVITLDKNTLLVISEFDSNGNRQYILPDDLVKNDKIKTKDLKTSVLDFENIFEYETPIEVETGVEAIDVDTKVKEKI